MKIGIVQSTNTEDVRSSSGTAYFMAKALAQHVGEVTYLGPDTTLTGRLLQFMGRALSSISYSALERRISPIHHRILAQHAARIFGPRIVESRCDVIFAPFASVEISALSTHVPIVYHTDMTWINGVDYYTVYSSLFKFAREEGERIEKAALAKATVCFFPSVWAAKSVAEHYHVDPKKIYIIPYGANFEASDLPSAEVALDHSLENGVELLWMGGDWKRKGGPTAYECLMELLRGGVQARLTVCGCVPPREYEHPNIRVVPFLDKTDPLQRRRLSQLFLDASFFLFPTTAEALGIVLCEASAHGLPCLVSNTGGVASAITDGVNGYLLPPDAQGKQYAEKILEVLANKSLYPQLVRRSYQTFVEKLNWDAWGRTVRPIFEFAMRTL